MPSYTPVMTARDSEAKRKRLLKAGRDLLDELSYEEITVSMIAVRAQMARGLVFYYFGDKDAFFRHVVRDFLDEQRTRFESNDPAQAPDPVAWLEAEVSIFLDIMAAHPQAMRTLVEQSLTSERLGGITMSDFTTVRIRQAFRLRAGDALLDTALHSWGYHCVDLVLRAQEDGSWNQTGIAAILTAECRAVLEAVQGRSPAAVRAHGSDSPA